MQSGSPRSSVPPDPKTDAEERVCGSQQRFQTRSEPPSGGHSEASGSERENPAETDGHLATQPGDQTNRAQPGSTPGEHANGTPGRQSPGQDTTDVVEEVPVDPKEPLEAYTWDELEEHFLTKMEECRSEEAEIEREFRGWID
ncbi:MAG: hypothetical protein L6R39_005322, partial [Caloplaca ligustica]